MDKRNLKAKLNYEGKLFKSNTCGDVIVLKYESSKNVLVRFVGTGYTTTVSAGNLVSGRVKDQFYPTVCGVGFLGGKFTKQDFKETSYVCWSSMLYRVFHTRTKENRPTYQDCSVSDRFKCFADFKFWCVGQVGYDSYDDKGRPFALDKDILVKGNKIYSADTCCFVPREINSLFNTHGNASGDCSLGVCKKGSKFQSSISKYGERVFLGSFLTEQEAFQAYKTSKERYIKDVANKWKDQIDIRVYEALMNWEVGVDD